MPVVEKHAYVMADIGRTEYSNAFTPDRKTVFIPVVDETIKYNYLYKGTEVALVISNSLQVPSMKKFSIHPLMMRWDVIQVHYNPKIRDGYPSEEDHNL